MIFNDFGLVNTKKMFSDAIRRQYAIPAFNFYNMETLRAIIDAARQTHSPIILAVSESALQYMGDDLLMGMIIGMNLMPSDGVALHLDHGHSFEACRHAVELGFSSVMIDASQLSMDENIKLSRQVAQMAHQNNVSTEAELGILGGMEDENTNSEYSNYTNPDDVVRFVNETGVDSLAIAIGTSHGAYKRKSDTESLRFDILTKIANQLPNFPLVLHGASSVPEKFAKTINTNGGQIGHARGIRHDDLSNAAKTNICKINVDTDLRMAFTAGIRDFLTTHPEKFNPRDYLSVAIKNMTDICIDEITNIMNSKNKLTK